jgi:Co/Zn/Cd efflux system component
LAPYKGKIGSATLLTTPISLVEGAAALYSASLSLLVDSVHNISDELALIASIWRSFCLAVSDGIPSATQTYSTRRDWLPSARA